jgi:hypothetical protein
MSWFVPSCEHLLAQTGMSDISLSCKKSDKHVGGQFTHQCRLWRFYNIRAFAFVFVVIFLTMISVLVI